MKIAILKILRIISFVPFVALIILASHLSAEGVHFFDTKYYGCKAFILTIIAYGIAFHWIGLLCVGVIIVTSFIICRSRHKI